MIQILTNRSQGGGVYPYVDRSEEFVTINDGGYKILNYTPGNNVKITECAEYFSSIIADEKELITENRSGRLTVNLVDPVVKVRFKSGLTNISTCFWSCSNLVSISNNIFYDLPDLKNASEIFSQSGITSVPDGIFDNNLEITDVSFLFNRCKSLVTIPEKLFANNTKIIDFSYCFRWSDKLVTMPVDNDSTPIYNRSGEGKEGYAIVTNTVACFFECNALLEIYKNIPGEWR